MIDQLFHDGFSTCPGHRQGATLHVERLRRNMPDVHREDTRGAPSFGLQEVSAASGGLGKQSRVLNDYGIRIYIYSIIVLFLMIIVYY